MFVYVHEEQGNVTVAHMLEDDGFVRGRFFFRQQDNNVSIIHDGSFLHFVQFVPASGNVSNVNGTNGGNTSDADFVANATHPESSNTTNTTSTTEKVEDVIPELKLVLEDIPVEDEDGVIRHTVWTEERLDNYAIRLSVTLENGKVCYLAFENDGTLVENPCRTDLMRKDIFYVFPAFF